MTHRYLHGPLVDQILADEALFDDEIYWALADNLGTVRTLLDSEGNRIRDLVFAAWGEITQDTNPSVDFPFAFTGREYDRETGLYFYRARYYDPRTGRFISEDPIGFAAGDTNLSRYVGNSPTNLTDPTGQESWAEWLARLLWPGLVDPADVARTLNDEREYIDQINKILGTDYQKLAEISGEHRAHLQKVLKLPKDFDWDCVEKELEVVGQREGVMDAAETALEVADNSAQAADVLSGGVGGAGKAAAKKAIKEGAEQVAKKAVKEGAEQVAKKAGRKAGKAAIKSGAKHSAEEATEAGAKTAGKAATKSANRGAKARKAKPATEVPCAPVRPIQCFPPDTLTSTEAALRPIAQVEAGERVWAYDFQAGVWRLCVVECRHDANYEGPLVTLYADAGQVTATAFHPFWVVEGEDLESRPALRHVDVSEDRGQSLPGRWVNSHDLREGDVVFLRDRGPVTVRRVWQRSERTPVCNLTLQGLHTFAVGEMQVLVHNMSGSFDPSKAAKHVLPGRLKREFPSQYLDKSLNEIKDMLKNATGAEKRALQKAKKILEQQERLMGD